ncbi:hypothetical protein AGDE_13804 [Angomonas deanei]|uniref:Uncharacterized protein n=1 Tax=Angomonas deanei TaxID=59799 RepID=A0A7G2CU71_9TRYP|nr:hypothetical protein AGDE_13804 [Angomonas deanei]CAD2222839.1 hypothetical protein, conserved [Angomonas deanei]|eukprot:EPY21755.1 hypothetical protein AGDE_13804 [Angomonas deanei]
MWPCEHLLYVAMSRVRNPEQLSISHFHRDLVRAASDCVLFDDCLPAVTEVKVKPYFIAATWKRSPQRRKKVLKRAQLDRLAKRLAEKKRIQKEEAEEREKKRITAIQTSLQNS